MHVRRALLLFAIVLLLAGLAASISPPQRERESEEPAPAEPAPAPGDRAERAQLRFSDEGEPRTRSLQAGASARVTVTTTAPGQVEIPGLGRNAFSEPGAPAVFALLVERPGRYPVRFEPGGDAEGRRIGTIVVSRSPSR